MTTEQYFKNLTPPEGPVDIVLDTDAFNEIDDQFAIGYMIRKTEKFNVKGICAAPFFNSNSTGPADGMERSYQEILKLLKLAERQDLEHLVYKGSLDYLKDEKTPAESEAADFMAKIAEEYSPEKPLYIVAIGAITNVASAILKNPKIKENCVVVWLGGHATHMPYGCTEFNMKQDIAAARVVMGCGVPFVQLPCSGVVERFALSKYDLLHFLKGKNPLSNYLCENTIRALDARYEGKPWSKVIWDVTAVAWLLNGEERFMKSKLIPAPIPEYDQEYAYNDRRHLICYVYQIKRDLLFEELFDTLNR